jgi:chemotaxis protein histidine kinase CheA
MEKIEEMINEMGSIALENAERVRELEHQVEEMRRMLESMNVGELISAIKELQNEVAEVADVPVGMLFNRLTARVY